MTTKKKTRVRRTFSVEEKLKAILLVWTDRKSGAQICKEMDLNWTLLDRWQNQAMEGMLSALEPKRKEEAVHLNSRLEKLLEKKLSARNTGFKKLEGRLASLQQKQQRISD